MRTASVNYAKEALQKLTMQDIIRGKDDNLFEPRSDKIYAEFVTMLHKYAVAKKNKSMGSLHLSGAFKMHAEDLF